MTLVVLFELAASFSTWPMTWEQSAVTVTTSDLTNFRWDFNDPNYQKLFTNTFTRAGNNITFYVRAFSSLTSQERPPGSAYPYGVNSMRCGQISGQFRCLPLSNIFDYEWTPKSDSNLGAGIVWESNGEPNYIGNDQFEDWEMEFEFACNSGSTAVDPSWIVDWTVTDPRLVLRWENAQSCPSPTTVQAVPTPAFSPKCNFEARSPSQANWGLRTDLRDLNNGRFGNSKSFNSLSAHTGLWVLFSPCERFLRCPWGVEGDACGVNAPASVAVCAFDGSVSDPALVNCTAFGTVDDTTTAHLTVPGDVEQGFNYVLNDTNSARATQVFFWCDRTVPNGHLLIDAAALSSDELVLTLDTRSKEVCARSLSNPVPMDGCVISRQEGNYRLDLNLSWLSSAANPWVWPVTVNGLPFSLRFSPCDGQQCPVQADCAGDDGATVWLCEAADAPLCTAYGLQSQGLTASIPADYIYSGAVVQYSGHNHRRAVISCSCDPAIPDGSLAFSDASLIDDVRYASVLASAACPKVPDPTPSPPPRVIPAKPDSRPTSSLVTSPMRRALFDNEKGSVPIRETQEAGTGGQHATIYTEWISWDMPRQDRANAWQCGLTTVLSDIADLPPITISPATPSPSGFPKTSVLRSAWSTEAHSEQQCQSTLPATRASRLRPCRVVIQS
jgi:hypothetical protein